MDAWEVPSYSGPALENDLIHENTLLYVCTAALTVFMQRVSTVFSYNYLNMPGTDANIALIWA